MTRWASLAPAALAMALVLAAGGLARGDDSGSDPLAGLLARNAPVICRDQTYALCAGSACYVFNNVAYCSCEVHKGDSVSSPFNYDHSNVCNVNADGANNGYMVSTFSPPKSLITPSGDRALYKCPRTSFADYAKCDGGICFTSTQGQSIPGFGKLGSDQIMCSCPVQRANMAHGLEIIGPYPCEEAFFRNCNPLVANNATGTKLYDGTSVGSTAIATRKLDGSGVRLNICR